MADVQAGTVAPWVLAFTVVLPVGPAAGAAEVYYVDTDSIGGAASDANPGTLTQPWLTIAKANATVQAGDTAFLRGGTYNEIISPQQSGTEQDRITYRNHGGEQVTIVEARYAVDLLGRS